MCTYGKIEDEYGEYKLKVILADRGCENNGFMIDELVLYPLYKNININLKEVVPKSTICVDLFCKKCMRQRNFTFFNIGEKILLDEDVDVDNTKKYINRNNFLEIVAKGECDHELYMLFENITENVVRKIGQTPSPEEMDESLNKPTIKDFLEMYNRPMYEFEINRLDDEDIKKIKKKTFDEVNVYNELEVKNKISRYECNKSKNCIYEKEKEVLVNYYNMKYNIPYGHKPESGKEIDVAYFNLNK